MFCGLEEERTRFRKKKKRKKPHRDQKWVGRDKRYLKTYNRVNYFLPYVKPFLIETAFCAKLSKRFYGPKIKITGLIASKFDTNLQLINLKLLSKFHAARPNCSRVISKSLKSHTR